MRFMMLMIPKQFGAADGARMARYTAELTRAGVLLACDGLLPPGTGARVVFEREGAKPRVVDGAEDAVGGYWLIQVKSWDEAIEWASRCPATAGDVIEVRKVIAA